MRVERPFNASQIKWVVLKLSEFSPSFRRLADGGHSGCVDETIPSIPLAEPELNVVEVVLEDEAQALAFQDEEIASKPVENEQRLDTQKLRTFQKDPSKNGRESWVADDNVKECFGCQTTFGAFVWKHHCRACGLIFCDYCTRDRALFTPATGVYDESYQQKEKRVCGSCKARLQSCCGP